MYSNTKKDWKYLNVNVKVKPLVFKTSAFDFSDTQAKSANQVQLLFINRPIMVVP